MQEISYFSCTTVLFYVYFAVFAKSAVSFGKFSTPLERIGNQNEQSIQFLSRSLHVAPART